MFARGGGTMSCKGATVEGSSAVDGGGLYIISGATMEWECDLISNSALSGPGM